MKSGNHGKRRSIVLFVFWVVSYFALSMLMFCKMVYQKVNHVTPQLFLGIDKNFYFILCLLIAYFLPFMLLIHRQSKHDDVRWLEITSKIILFFLFFIFIMSIIVLLGAIISQ